MDRLEAWALVALGWLTAQLQQFAKWSIRAAWFLYRLTPAQRRYFAAGLYLVFLEEVYTYCDQRPRDNPIGAALARLVFWLDPRFRRWTKPPAGGTPPALLSH